MTAGRGASAIAVAALTGALALVGGASAQGRCAKRSGDRLAPVLTFPCAGARLRAGHNFIWRANGRSVRRRAYFPYLNVTRRRPRRGHLPRDNTGYGIYAQMHAVRGRRGQFRYRAPRRRVAGYWLFRRGVWFVQVSQIDPAGRGSIRYGPVERITIH
jgi:hypothetical protein